MESLTGAPFNLTALEYGLVQPQYRSVDPESDQVTTVTLAHPRSSMLGGIFVGLLLPPNQLAQKKEREKGYTRYEVWHRMLVERVDLWYDWYWQFHGVIVNEETGGCRHTSITQARFRGGPSLMFRCTAGELDSVRDVKKAAGAERRKQQKKDAMEKEKKLDELEEEYNKMYDETLARKQEGTEAYSALAAANAELADAETTVEDAEDALRADRRQGPGDEGAAFAPPDPAKVRRGSLWHLRLPQLNCAYQVADKEAAEKAVVVALAAKAAAEDVYITAMDAHKASERLDSVAGDKVTAADSELAELQQQEEEEEDEPTGFESTPHAHHYLQDLIDSLGKGKNPLKEHAFHALPIYYRVRILYGLCVESFDAHGPGRPRSFRCRTVSYCKSALYGVVYKHAGLLTALSGGFRAEGVMDTFSPNQSKSMTIAADEMRGKVLGRDGDNSMHFHIEQVGCVRLAPR
jgi:hypothetical protein